MADSFTANLNLTKPEVGASTDTWGTKINIDLDQLDAKYGPGGVLLLASGGTGANTAATARTNLGCGTIATQSAAGVAITGGTASGVAVTLSSVDSTPVGSTTPSSGKFTSVQLSTGAITFADGTSQSTSASALNSPSVFSISGSGSVSGVPIFQTEKLDATSGALTRVLPSAVGITGHQITGKKMDASANGISYVTSGTQTIDAASFVTLFRQFDAVTIQSDGANWILI